MGRRNILRPFQVYTDSDSTLNKSSQITDISGLDNITHLVVVDPAVDGVMKVEFSIQEQQPTVFYPLSFGESLNLVGASETVYSTKIENHGFKWMRLSFVNNAGTGNINAWISGNSVGA